MTGGELAAAAAAGQAIRAVGKIAEEDASSKKALLEVAKSRPAFTAAADSMARRIAFKEDFVLQLFRPLAWMMRMSGSYFETDFAKDMAEKLESIPEEHRVTPKASVAAQALQGLAFSHDEPDLKEMYLALLATASDDRVGESAHPSFVDSIRQLTSAEAVLLRKILLPDVAFAVVELTKSMPGVPSTVKILQRHIMDPSDPENPGVTNFNLISTFVDNWIRLGLVHLSYSTELADVGVYDWVIYHPEFQRVSSGCVNGEFIGYNKGYIVPTSLGLQFASAVGLDDAQTNTKS